MSGYGECRSRAFLRRDFREHLKIVEIAFDSGIRVEQVGLSGSAYRKKLQSVFPVNTS